MTLSRIYNSIFGAVLGDALGLPLKGFSREHLKENPIKCMTGYRISNYGPGTWSNNTGFFISSLDALSNPFKLETLAANYLKLGRKEDFICDKSEVVELLHEDRSALINVAMGIDPAECGSKNKDNNGDNSYCRVIPLAYIFSEADESLTEADRFRIVSNVSSITNGNIMSILCNFFLVEFCNNILRDNSLTQSLSKTQEVVKQFCPVEEKEILNKLLTYDKLDFLSTVEKDLETNSYCLNTLEIALWSVFNSTSYRESIITAINLGGNASTVGFVTGAIAGLHFNESCSYWLTNLKNIKDVKVATDKFLMMVYGTVYE